MCSDQIRSTPVQLGDSNSLFGIRTAPTGNVSRIGVITLNAGLLHHVGPFRLHVDIANQLARIGFPSLRIDQSGKGESRRRAERSRIESLLMDYDDAFKSLRSIGASATILIGLCSGADDALYMAYRRDSIRGLILLDGYACKNTKYHIHHYANRIFKVAPWIRAFRRLIEGHRYGPEIDIRDWEDDAEMIQRFVHILEKDTRILSVFTAGQNYYNHLGQLEAGLPDGCNAGGLEEVYFDEVDHTYNVTYHRKRLLEKIASWMTENFSR